MKLSLIQEILGSFGPDYVGSLDLAMVFKTKRSVVGSRSAEWYDSARKQFKRLIDLTWPARMHHVQILSVLHTIPKIRKK